MMPDKENIFLKMNSTELVDRYNKVIEVFDRWTSSIGLPNDKKPLKDITSSEYKDSLYNFYKSLNVEDSSFRSWLESFYAKNEIDFDYLDLMSWDNWVLLYIKVMIRYIEEGIIEV